ncbi:MAG: DUF3097 family protein [Acidimicrobiales bacterium]
MGILSEPLDLNGPTKKRPEYASVPAELGMTIRHRSSFKTGTIIAFDPNWVTMRGEDGREFKQRNEPGAFSYNGTAVTLVRPTKAHQARAAVRTASGSIAIPNAPARVARPSRIYVEGIHDAELIERVWGDDLRLEGLVVEPLHGADDLAELVRTFGPRPGRRLGVLLDHLVAGSKETRIAEEVNHPDVCITGHPFVDVWQCIKPSVLGISQWPVIERGTDWKRGVCAELGMDDEPGVVWKQLLSNVDGYVDLEPSFVGAVEQLIDFTT